MKITSGFIKGISNKLIVSIEKLKHVSRSRFLGKMNELYSKYKQHLQEITNFIGTIDVIKSDEKY